MSHNQIISQLRTVSVHSRHLSVLQSQYQLRLSGSYPKKPTSKTEKRTLLLILLFTIALTSSVILMVASFLPLFIERNYNAISMTETGLIIRYDSNH